jgi:GTPase SAR1 family protein
MKDTIPVIEPIKLKSYESKQSKYSMVASLPMRSVLLGPSGSGKTVLLVSMILDLYRDCFARIYIWSPSVFVDQSWEPVKKYIEKDLKINTDKEKIYFDDYRHEDLEKVIDTQYKLIDHMKKQEYKKLYNILIVIDDFADNPSFTRHSKLLHSLYTRGRHLMISTITSTQVFNALSPIIRKSITQLYVYKLRNYKDLEAVLEELSALADKKVLLEMYQMATHEPYSFWYINLIAKKLSDMFYIRFNQRMLIEY